MSRAGRPSSVYASRALDEVQQPRVPGPRVVYIVRHAESMANAVRADTGHEFPPYLDWDRRLASEFADPCLSPLGRKQAASLCLEGDLLLVSPLLRTRETVAYSNIRCPTVLVVPEAREVRNCVADFQSHELPKNLCLSRSRAAIRPETWDEAWRRALRVAALIREAQWAQRTVVVCHGHFAPLLYGTLTGHWPKPWNLPNASFYTAVC